MGKRLGDPLGHADGCPRGYPFEIRLYVQDEILLKLGFVTALVDLWRVVLLKVFMPDRLRVMRQYFKIV